MRELDDRLEMGDRRKMDRRNAFTLVEILSVIAIIAILASIGVGAFNSWKNRSEIAQAKSVIADIEMALEMYKTEIGYYPQRNTSPYELNSGLAGGYVYRYLVVPFTPAAITYGPYMTFKGSYSYYAVTIRTLLDPWGRAYRVYTYPGSLPDTTNFIRNRSSYYIASNGPDRTAGTADDINNCQK